MSAARAGVPISAASAAPAISSLFMMPLLEITFDSRRLRAKVPKGFHFGATVGKIRSSRLTDFKPAAFVSALRCIGFRKSGSDGRVGKNFDRFIFAFFNSIDPKRTLRVDHLLWCTT